MLRAWQSFNVLKCKSISRYNLVHILPTSSKKSAMRLQQSKLLTKAELSLQSCALFVDNEARTCGNRDPIYFGVAWRHIIWKTQGFAPESVFTRDCTRSRTLAPTGDDKMLLPWWHDGDGRMKGVPLDIRP